MYKAIIVEDELLIRVAYQSIVDWQAYGFELVGMFENGQEALEAFDELKPDFVLTDTIMPLCNGIELIRQIKERAPETICIILSAYGDLDYVKEGMRIGIDDYLLKLDITPERLGSLLESVALKLQKQKRSGVELVSGERQKEREDFIRRWIRGEFTERDMIQDYLKFYGIKLNMHQLICLSILIEPEKQCAFTAEMSGTMKQVVIQTLQSAGTWVLVDMQSNYLCAVGCCDDDTMQQYKESVMKSIRFSLKSVMNLSDVTIQCEAADDPLSVPVVFRAMAPCSAADHTISVVIQEIVDRVLHLQYAEVIEGLKELSSLFSETPFLLVDAVRNNCSYILMGLQTAMKNDPLLEEWMKDYYTKMKSDLLHCFHSRDFIHWVDEFGVKLEEMRQSRISSATVAEKATEYICRHYSENLSLSDIAEYCSISATYLSRIFPQELGKGVQEYLIDRRIKEAKKLLMETNKKIYEIAAGVGYPDPVYFNKVFKRNTGMTPKEYRMQKIAIKTKNDKKI